jgi:hypothetical protein
MSYSRHSDNHVGARRPFNKRAKNSLPPESLKPPRKKRKPAKKPAAKRNYQPRR